MKSCIVIDCWKFDIFEKILTDAGFEFEKKPGVTDDTFSLVVENDDLKKLDKTVRKANYKAAAPRLDLD